VTEQDLRYVFVGERVQCHEREPRLHGRTERLLRVLQIVYEAAEILGSVLGAMRARDVAGVTVVLRTRIDLVQHDDLRRVGELGSVAAKLSVDHVEVGDG